MKVVVQRVSRASVQVGKKTIAAIGRGLVILIGIGREDTKNDAMYLARKISQLRIFENEKGQIDYSVKEIGGEVIVVSQFTLYADCQKGRRPSFLQAERPERARSLYRSFITSLIQSGIPVQEGVFQEVMSLELVNEGPFTLLLESQGA